MEWQEYLEKFNSLAIDQGFTETQISLCNIYAKKLFDKGLPIIYDHYHLSILVGYQLDYLRGASNHPIGYYRNFQIPKKSGATREINEPLPSLKEIQKWILTEILSKCPVSEFAKAYVINRSIKDNARFHRKQSIVLTVDIKNFFGSINEKRIYLFYRRIGYSKSVAKILSKLCCLNNSLPQGAPTSPALSNLVSLNLDKRIFGFARKNGIRFSRYADDIVFSGNFEPGFVIKFIKKLFQEEGYEINDKKIRVMHSYQRQLVTGIVVNQKMQAPKQLRKNLRQTIYYIQKYGLASHLESINNLSNNYLYHLLGLINFVTFINPNDHEFIEYKAYVKKLLPQKQVQN